MWNNGAGAFQLQIYADGYNQPLNTLVSVPYPSGVLNKWLKIKLEKKNNKITISVNDTVLYTSDNQQTTCLGYQEHTGFIPIRFGTFTGGTGTTFKDAQITWGWDGYIEYIKYDVQERPAQAWIKSKNPSVYYSFDKRHQGTTQDEMGNAPRLVNTIMSSNIKNYWNGDKQLVRADSTGIFYTVTTEGYKADAHSAVCDFGADFTIAFNYRMLVDDGLNKRLIMNSPLSGGTFGGWYLMAATWSGESPTGGIGIGLFNNGATQIALRKSF